MKKFHYTDAEKEFNKVLKYQHDQLQQIPSLKKENEELQNNITASEQLLAELGFSKQLNEIKKRKSSSTRQQRPVIKLPSWEELVKEAESYVPGEVDLQSLFTEEELRSNEAYLQSLRNDFAQLHQLDQMDYTICIVAGILAAAVDIFLVGIPQKTSEGIKAGPLANYLREKLDKLLPPEKIRELEGKFKVPYDPATNYNLAEKVEGLSSWFHRYHSLGHDPILGFIFGVFDIMTGRFTAIDKNGKIISQVVGDVPEGMNIFKAIYQVFGHMLSDVNTSMGLPVPLMTLANKLHFGKIGQEELTIAEVVRGMYAQGYDFVHFCAMSIPTMIIEVLVRLSYCVKRINEGHSLKESLPVGGREKKPKLHTMLFISHLICTSVNGGKVYFTKDPMSINYPEWMAFIKYSFSQLKWTLIEKPLLRNRYVDDRLNEEWQHLSSLIGETWQQMEEEYLIIS